MRRVDRVPRTLGHRHNKSVPDFKKVEKCPVGQRSLLVTHYYYVAGLRSQSLDQAVSGTRGTNLTVPTASRVHGPLLTKLLSRKPCSTFIMCSVWMYQWLCQYAHRASDKARLTYPAIKHDEVVGDCFTNRPIAGLGQPPCAFKIVTYLSVPLDVFPHAVAFHVSRYRFDYQIHDSQHGPAKAALTRSLCTLLRLCLCFTRPSMRYAACAYTDCTIYAVLFISFTSLIAFLKFKSFYYSRC